MMLLIDNQIFPVVNLFKYSYKKTNVILFSCDSYSKMTFNNRFVIAGSNGLIHLSVPIINGRNHQALLKDVRICYQENWQTRHWRTLVSCYSKSPFFEYYRDSLETFFIDKPNFLFDFNLAVLYWLKQVLKFSTEITVLETLDNLLPGEEIEDLRNKWLPKNFQSDVSRVYYPQVFEERIGFQPNLSILDMLFNMGPQTGAILTKDS